MNNLPVKPVVSGVLFLLVFALGFWLNRTGKPYPTGIFTLHKLVSLGAAVYLSVIVIRANRASPLDGLQMTVALIAGLCFLVTIVTGGLVSVDKTFPGFVTFLHQAAPFLTLLAAAALFFLIPGLRLVNA